MVTTCCACVYGSNRRLTFSAHIWINIIARILKKIVNNFTHAVIFPPLTVKFVNAYHHHLQIYHGNVFFFAYVFLRKPLCVGKKKPLRVYVFHAIKANPPGYSPEGFVIIIRFGFVCCKYYLTYRRFNNRP